MKQLKMFGAIVFIAVTMCWLMSCEKEMEPSEQIQQLDMLESDSLRMIKLGKKLENPYEIHAFRKAYQKVLDSMNMGFLKTGKAFKVKKKDTSEIKPNYVYIRFDPEDDLQENLLREHKKLIFVDYPFEYEDGERYHKENPIKTGERLSFYASIPRGAKYPKSIPHKILQKMYMPEKDSKYDRDTDSDKWTLRGHIDDDVDFMNHVIEQAYTDTDNKDLLPEPLLGEKNEGCETCFLGINLRRKWRPRGNVQIYDDNLGTSKYVVRECKTTYEYDYTPCYQGNYANCPRRIEKKSCKNVTKNRKGSYVPLDGTNILIRDTWTLDRAIANAQGNFIHKSVRAKVRYIIKWDRFEFSIRDNTGLIQAEDKGPKLYKRPWNLKINGGRMKYRGQIFQAAMHFYYHDIGGLTRPPTNGFWKTQIKIAAIEKNTGPSSTKMQLGHGTFGIVPHIKIKEYGEPSEEVYGTTIHELAHAAHWRVDPISWDNLVERGYLYNLGSNNPGQAGASARRLMESWATAVEIYLTRKRYRRIGQDDYEYKSFRYRGINSGNLQNKSINEKFYTTGIYDLLDDFNQHSDFGIILHQLPNDNVKGFTMKRLEDALIGSTRWEEYQDNVIRFGGNPEDVNTLFGSW